MVKNRGISKQPRHFVGNLSKIRMGNDELQLLFFSTWQSVRYPRIDGGEIAWVDFKNIDSLVGLVIAEGKATLKELQESYSLEDLFYLYEVIMVTKSNEWLAYKHAERQASKKQ